MLRWYSKNMPHSPEFIGKAHEKLTRDILNGVSPQKDTKKMLQEISEKDRKRVEVGAKKTAEFIQKKTDFEIEEAKEVGDRFKPTSNKDTDIVVKGNNSEKGFSLKMTVNPTLNVRNTLASKISEDIFKEKLSDLLTSKEMKKYKNLTQEFSEGKISGSNMASTITKMFCKYLNQKKDENENKLRKNLLKDMRIDSNMVACKVTPDGKFKGFVSLDRESFRKFKNMEGDLEVFTKETNNTSIFFKIDGKIIFRIDMYGQYQGNVRKPRVKSVYRVEFGKE